MKINNMGLPSNVIFSGNGSKILDIVTPNLKLISELTQQIFSNIYGVSDFPAPGLKINIEKAFPKEVTSKGALIHFRQGIREFNIHKLKKTFTCAEHQGKETLLFEDINDGLLDQVIKEVRTFNALFISLNDVMNFEDYFGITSHSFDIFKQNVNSHLKEFLRAGIEFNARMDGSPSQPKSPVPETLFFYPLVETIQNLLKALSAS